MMLTRTVETADGPMPILTYNGLRLTPQMNMTGPTIYDSLTSRHLYYVQRDESDAPLYALPGGGAIPAPAAEAWGLS